MEVIISIIMPVYNAERFLKRAINSIINQTFKNWELILINDGSTDNSGYICDEYSKKDNRIKVIHKKNEGVAVARQIGIEMATGTFIIHHDSDDWIDPDMLDQMNDSIDTNDVLITDFYSNNGTNEVIVKQEPTNCNDNTLLLKDLFLNLHGSCCNKLIRKSFINKYNLQFFKGINNSEDLLFWVQAFSKDDIKVKYLPKAFYHYYCPIDIKTLSTNYSKKMLDIDQLLIEKLEEFIPSDLRDELITICKLRIKMVAFEHPIYRSEEFINIYPEVNKYIFKFKTSLFNRLLLYLSCKGLYKPATYLYKIKLKIRKRYVR